jgi:hypothetical protein
MSNKTNFKRIALVAITALGAGILSVSSAQGANVVADNVVVESVSGVTNAGACSISTGGQGGTFVTGSLVTVSHTTSESIYILLAGPAVFEGGTAVTSGGAVLTATTAYDIDGSSGETFTFRLSAVGAVTVTMSPSSSTAAVDSFTINSVVSCATSTYNAAKSNVTISTVAETDTDDVAGVVWASRMNNIDTTDAEIIDRAAGSLGYIRAQLNNEYGDNLSSKPIVVSTNSSSCTTASNRYILFQY